ncbi:Protein of unknown function [Paenibacillus algorifonticola]|uniref:DUF2634 domain-containing protein n=1 Tax=Paenibacillus algorifonticola TaxID=684063 RepID=A0A1I2ESQ7_9BACL|nr:DUF2634 domain-containing protein [Paenibacillus algorifonticola]SFE96082.1 Protein of unknown function [Paenibacillus algorifonticola]
MIPQGAIIGGLETETAIEPSRTYYIDFANKRLSGMTDGLSAIKQAVFKILQTERYRYFIYSFDYGSELDLLNESSHLYIRSELKRRITEALLADDRIADVTDFELTVEGDKAAVSFTVITDEGSFKEEVMARV